MPRTQRLISKLVVACAVAGLIGCGGGTGPSDMTEVVEGNAVIPALSLTVVPIQIGRQGNLSSVITWNNFFNDIDSGLLRGTCTAPEVSANAAGCNVEAALGFDDTNRSPSRFDASVTPGAYSLLIYNFGFSADTAFYRLEIN
jgi:hypothetical protein